MSILVITHYLFIKLSDVTLNNESCHACMPCRVQQMTQQRLVPLFRLAQLRQTRANLGNHQEVRLGLQVFIYKGKGKGEDLA